MKTNNTLQESIALQRRVIAGYEQAISENKTRRAYFIALNDYKQAAKMEQAINRDEQDLAELKQQLDAMENQMKPTTTESTTNTPATMNANDNEYLDRLRAELQEYHNNASKGGANRQRNMAMLAEDIARLEASANETTATVTVSVTDNGNKCEYTDNGKVLAAITYRKEFDAYDVNTPTVGYMTTDVTEAHKACECGITWLLEQSGRKAAFDYSAVEEYNAEHYHNAIA